MCPRRFFFLAVVVFISAQSQCVVQFWPYRNPCRFNNFPTSESMKRLFIFLLPILYSLSLFLVTIKYFPDLTVNNSEFWVSKGDTFFDMEFFEEAYKAYKRATVLKFDHSSAWLKKGLTLTKLKKYKDAIQEYDQALSFVSYPDLVIFHKGYTYLRWEKYQNALEMFEQCNELYVDRHSLLLNRGFALMNLR